MPKRYPAIEFTARHGRTIAVAAASVLVLIGLGGFLQAGSTGFLAAGLLVAALVYLGLRLGAEVVEVIADTLLPR